MSSMNISEVGAPILHLQGWRAKIFQINESVSQKRTYTPRLHGFQMLDLCSQTPPGIFISQRDQRDQRDPQVLDQEPFQTIDLFSWVTSCPLIRWRNLIANLTHRHLVDAPTCHKLGPPYERQVVNLQEYWVAKKLMTDPNDGNRLVSTCPKWEC